MKALTKVILITTIIFILAYCISAQTILHVPSQYPTIQSAVTASQGGDTILVQPGIYYENIFWENRNGVTLLSASDSSDTIIDGGGNDRVLNVIGDSIYVEGFTFTNGINLKLVD